MNTGRRTDAKTKDNDTKVATKKYKNNQRNEPIIKYESSSHKIELHLKEKEKESKYTEHGHVISRILA